MEIVLSNSREEPEGDYEEVAISVRNAYNKNIKHIAETIYEEAKSIFSIKTAVSKF